MVRWARLAVALLAASGLLWSTAARAAGDERVIPLANLMDGAATAELQGETDELVLPAMVPPTGPVRQVTLSITYENGVDVLPEHSRLLLLLNGEAVAELPLSAYRGPVTAAITLPPDRLPPGRNLIALRQEAEHRAVCNVRGTYDLWTRIDLVHSVLTVRAEGPPPPPDLAMLPQLMAAADRAGEPLTVLRAGTALRPDHLGWGAIVAQTYGLLLDRRAPLVTAAALPAGGQPGAAPPQLPGSPLPGTKAVLVGTRDELAPVLTPAVVQEISGPFLGVYPGAAAGGFLVVVSGRSPAEVDLAAMRLADVSHPLPPQTSLLVDVAQAPPATPPDRVLRAARYRLSELGFGTATHVGYRYRGRLDIALPADYRPVADRAVALRVNAAFDGEIGRGAVLNVRVNGKLAGAIEVDRRSSGDIRRAEMRLPMRMFWPGPNRIEFEAELPPAQETDCLFAVRRPKFVLSDSSELEIPPFARLSVLPDLGTTARTGFPYVRPGRGGALPFDLVLTAPQDAWQGAALTLMARLSQNAGVLLRPVPAVGWTESGSRDAVIVGPVGSLPQAALAGTPLPPDRLASLLEAGTRMSLAAGGGEPIPAAERRRIVERLRAARPSGSAAAPAPSAETAAEAPADRWARLAQPAPPPRSADTPLWRRFADRVLELTSWAGKAAVAETNSDGLAKLGEDDLLPDTALLQFRAPAGLRLTWTVLTGPDPAVAERAMQRLAEPRLWTELEGGAALWRSGGGGLSTLRPVASYGVLDRPTDAVNLFLIAASNLSERIDILFGLLLSTVIVLTIVTHALLRAGRRRREADDAWPH